MKAKKKIDLINTFCFPAHPPKIQPTTLLHRNPGLDLYLSTAPNVEIFMIVQLIKYCKKPKKNVLLISSPILSLYLLQTAHTLSLVLSHTCVHTKMGHKKWDTKNGTHAENLLNFTNKLQKGSGNMVTLFRITQNFAWCSSSLHLIENLIFQDKSEAYSLMGFDGLVGVFFSYFL